MGLKEKAVVTTIVAVTAATVGYSIVYLPFYSEMATERRRQVREGTIQNPQRAAGAGSMWGSINAASKRAEARKETPAGGELNNNTSFTSTTRTSDETSLPT